MKANRAPLQAIYVIFRGPKIYTSPLHPRQLIFIHKDETLVILWEGKEDITVPALQVLHVCEMMTGSGTTSLAIAHYNSPSHKTF